MMEQLYKFLWNDWFWMPVNQTWKIMENQPESGIYIPQPRDMLWSIPLGVLLLGIRFLFEQFVLVPLGYWMGVKKKKPLTVKLNAQLVAYLESNGVKKDIDAKLIAKKTGLPVRDVERGIRNWLKQTKPSDIKRFIDCGWHFVFYLGIFVFGLVTLWDKPWFWTTVYCWTGWPKLDCGFDVYLYYLFELSFYWSLVFSMLTDHKRKDFVQMIVHHVATILLVYFSWSVNFVRIGTLVLITHDAADFPMAMAKMFKYSGHKKLCEIFLGIFIVVWILSRLVYYPFIVIYSASVEVYSALDAFPAYYFFNGLLILLQGLHIIWTYMIARIAARSLFQDKLGDVRSDSDDSD